MSIKFNNQTNRTNQWTCQANVMTPHIKALVSNIGNQLQWFQDINNGYHV